jgi:hypothetical protein
MSKFLLNLLLQISKALVNSKIQFLIWDSFSLLSARSTMRPTWPLALPARWPRCPHRLKPPRPAHLARVSVASSREYIFPFGSRHSSWPPLPRLSVKRAPAVNSIPHLQPPELTCAATASRPPSATQLRASGAIEPLPPRLHFPSLNSPLKPSLSSMALKPLTPKLTPPATPPRCSPDPYKRQAPPPEFTAPLPASLRFSPRSSLPLPVRRCLRFCTAVARPPRRYPSSGEALAKLPVLSSLYCAPAGELWSAGAAGGRTPVSVPPRSSTLCPRRRWSTVNRVRPAGPQTRGPGP